MNALQKIGTVFIQTGKLFISLFMLGILVIFVYVIGGAFYEVTTTETKKLGQTLAEDTKSFATGIIRQYPEVRDTAIDQVENKISLVIVVNYGTSEMRARQLGDNFVRAIKNTIKAEPNPSREIGEGIYNYLVGIYTPNESQIAIGAKDRSARSITW